MIGGKKVGAGVLGRRRQTESEMIGTGVGVGRVLSENGAKRGGPGNLDGTAENILGIRRGGPRGLSLGKGKATDQEMVLESKEQDLGGCVEAR